MPFLCVLDIIATFPYFSEKQFIGDHLTLVDVRKNDTGEVLCIAENGYPPLVSQKFELTIHCKFQSHPFATKVKELSQPFRQASHPTTLRRISQKLRRIRKTYVSHRRCSSTTTRRNANCR